MIAMQYRFVLPADYDMAIIRRRIADRGYLLDDFPGLAFKAYLYASRGDDALPGQGNVYAPFYLWRDTAGLDAFLGGAGFAALADDFGRPSVSTWIPWQATLADDLREAACASCEPLAIPAHADFALARTGEDEAARRDLDAGALAAVSAYDPAAWTLLRVRLWPHPRPGLARTGVRLYRVGHVSQPGAGH